MSQGAAQSSIIIADATGYPRSFADQFLANQYAPVTLNSASGTTAQTLLTAPAGQYYLLKLIQITIDPTCTIGAAGMVSISLTDTLSGQTVATLRAFIPASFAAPTVPTVNRQVSAPGFFWNSVNPGSVLQASINTALTAGSIRVSVGYGLTNTLIQNTQ